jgi:sigma-E factor negative regulatory protein RseC
MEEIGVVISTHGPIAKVAVQRKSVCDQCTAGTCHLTEGGAELEALNTARAKEGQKVKVVLKPYSYLKGSLIVYGLPLLALIAGAVAGKELLADSFKGLDPDLVSAIFAFGAFALSFLVVFLWSRRAEKKTEFKPVIEEILE